MDHHDRAKLVGETHARPTLAIDGPCIVLHEAFLAGDAGDAGQAARTFLGALCSSVGSPPPATDADHYIVVWSGITIKWERHGEFSSWTRMSGDRAGPPSWHAILGADAPPGVRVSAVRVEVGQGPGDFVAHHGYEHAASLVSGGAAHLQTDLALRPDGFVGYLLATQFEGSAAMGPARLGRLVRRTCEIETYRILALLAFPVARGVRDDLNRLDEVVSGAFGEGGSTDAQVLSRLTDAAQQVEQILTRTDFRFGAGVAYRRLVEARVAELREVRIEGQQRLGKFLDRRFSPAMDTVATTRGRLEAMATRIERACALLRTRVDLSLQQQNQELLRSMDTRAQLQLRLQETVEGFSVVAITYYAVMLLSKLVHGIVEPAPTGWMDSVLVVLVLAVVWMAIRATRRNLTRAPRPQ